MDIIWSSVTIIILCTWSILHLNVPAQHEPANIPQTIGKALFDFRHKMKWMVLTILCPEVILGLAAVDLYAARISQSKIAELAEKDGVPWSLTHSYFSNIGGFAIRFPDDPDESVSAEGRAWQWRKVLDMLPSAIVRICWNGKRSRFYYDAQAFSSTVQRFAMSSRICGDTPWAPHMGNSALADDILSDLPSNYGKLETALFKKRLVALRGNIWVLNTWGLIEARKAGIITRLPCVPESHLADRDKGDTLSKLIAVLQVAWLVGQLIQRWYNDQPSSQLEIMTLAFAVVAFATYLLLLRRPKDVCTHIYLDAARTPSSKEELSRIEKAYPQYYRGPGIVIGPNRYSYTIPNGTVHPDPTNTRGAILVQNIGMCVGAAVFGAVHLAAWNFDFPTPTEKYLWRAAAVLVTTFIPTVFLLSGSSSMMRGFRPFETGGEHGGLYHLMRLLVQIFWQLLPPIGFVAARLYLLIGSLRLVYYLPTAAYIATGVAEAPRIT